MERFFNTAGPVRPEIHYCLPPLDRLNLSDLLALIDQQKYFVLHAPRQTGKTSCLLALMERLNREARYTCLYANFEIGQGARENVDDAMRAILSEIAGGAAFHLGLTGLEAIREEVLRAAGGHGALNALLARWAQTSPKPIVLLIDEIDSLVGDTLISVLRQVRAGYSKRPAGFPQSVILCGVRDVRDYRIHSTREKEIITGGSAFNIKAESLRLGDFSRKDVGDLYRQHADETGQAFEPDALELVWDLTRGQPWLVNALGYETCFKMESGRDRSRPITAGAVMEAKERIVLRRETHIDQLVDKLQEERVRRVIEPILAGGANPGTIPPDDLSYVHDLGLVRSGAGQIEIANGIYREVIPRELVWTTQLTISQEPAWYVRPDGRIDMAKLMAAFQGFFREHSEHWIERFDYKEAGPQLLLQAFLQRSMNGGGRIEREYGLGRMRTDLLVVWPHSGGTQKTVIETKLVRGSRRRAIAEGIEQTTAYLARCGASEGHLVLFDRNPAKTWDEKIFRRDESAGASKILVWGM